MALTADAETLIDALNNQNFKVVIVDESHYMKSRSATAVGFYCL